MWNESRTPDRNLMADAHHREPVEVEYRDQVLDV